MFEESQEYDDDYTQRAESSLRALQRAALVIYGKFVAAQQNAESNDEEAATKEQFLSLQEVENIVREHANTDKSDNDNYVIGADTADEANKIVHAVMAALMDRIMSNVLQAGVNQGLLDCAYDNDSDDFVFSVTPHGKALVEEFHDEQKDNDESDRNTD